MTELQYSHWKDFSLRMADKGLGLRLAKSRELVRECVEWFFDVALENNYGTDLRAPIGSTQAAWCEVLGRAVKWGEEHENLLGRIQSWDHTDSHPTYRNQYGHQTNGPYVCDIVSEMEEHFNPYYWSDHSKYMRWNELWWSRVQCCIRAGIDMASEPSMGVMGFTAGDLRHMYDGDVPDWIFGNEKLEVQHWKGVIPGVGLVPGERTLNGTFASLPDSAPIWL